MADTDQRAVEALVRAGETLTTEELFDIVERHHADRPGVSRATLDAYARALDGREDSTFDTEAFGEVVDERLTDSPDWLDGDRLYELDDDGISQYPPTWHDRLRGERDPAAYLRFFEEVAPSLLRSASAGRPRANEDQLIDVMAAVGQLSHDAAKAEIEAARDDDRVAEDADQHPKAGVYLPED